jgi:hypothetical protein
VFYCLTRKGAAYIDRLSDYRFKNTPKTPNQIMMYHESMKFDICLAFLRLYPEYAIDFDYYTSYDGIRSDATITMTHKVIGKKYVFLLELERKKTIDRVFNEKLQKYEDAFKNGKDLKKLPNNMRILVVYSNLTFNPYLRPQQHIGNTLHEVSAVCQMTDILASEYKYGGSLPEYRYRFTPFPEFYRLNEAIWRKPGGQLTKLLNE